MTEYEKTKEGVTVRMYSGQKCSSKNRGFRSPTYTSKELREWCFSQKLFHELYGNWVKSGYKKGLKPSCNRTDDYRGYSLDRLELMTWEENRAKYDFDKINGINNKQNKAVMQIDSNGKLINVFHSAKQAKRETGVSQSHISECCVGNRKTSGGFMWKHKEVAA